MGKAQSLRGRADAFHTISIDLPHRNLPPTPVETLERCREAAHAEGIRYAYVGNVPGHRWENTYCHNCGAMIIRRGGFYAVTSMLRNGHCPHCAARIPGVWV